MSIIQFFRRADAALRLSEVLRDAVPSLTLSNRPPGPSAPLPAADEAERAWLTKEGYAVLVDAAPIARRLEAGVREIVAAGLPPLFLYLFDEVWQLGDALRARITAMLGASYELLEDVWAWQVSPGGKGWPPHRGGAGRLFDRQLPELLSVWVALSEVTSDRACMHIVPLDDDPGYPGDLHRVDAPLSSVRALPVRAGTALVWNANALHWGGGCSERAIGPRVSCSFSFGRSDARTVHGVRAVAFDERFDVAARLDVIAAQIEMYGGNEPIATEIVHWARANATLRAVAQRA